MIPSAVVDERNEAAVLGTPAGDAAVESAIAAHLAEVRAVAGWLWERGWAERNAGNVSIDVGDDLAEVVARSRGEPSSTADAPLHLLVSTAGARFRDIARDPRAGLVVVRAERHRGCYERLWPSDSGARRPTSELVSHLALHARLRSLDLGRRAVLHTHPTHLVALNHCETGADEGALNGALRAILPEVVVVLPEGVALAPYRLPGSPELADETVARAADHRLIVWDRHGCVAIERDLVEAFDLIDTVDKAARIHLTCLAAGHAPRGLTAEELDALRTLGAHVRDGA